MPRLNPEEQAAKWAQRTAAAVPEYQAGIMRVTQAPGQAAAAKEGKYQAGVTAAVTSGKWRRNVARVGLNDWQNAAINKGASRLASGAAAAQPKVVASAQRLGPIIDAVRAEIQAMPDNTVEDRINRAAEWARRMNRRTNGAGNSGR